MTLELWNKLKDVPKEAQKAIRGGRLNGMTDISPQWRYHKMTETFGPVGIGWKFTIDKQFVEQGTDGVCCAITNISMYVKHDGEWSDAIPGTGGSDFVAKEKAGLRTSDEAFKMSLTDALSVAMKMLGVGAVIYSGGNDYSKYTTPKQEEPRAVRKLITKQEAVNLVKGALSISDLQSIWAQYSKQFKAELDMNDFAAVELEKDAKKAEFEAA